MVDLEFDDGLAVPAIVNLSPLRLMSALPPSCAEYMPVKPPKFWMRTDSAVRGSAR